MKKRILALMLSIVMLVSLFPVGVLAADGTVLDAAIFCSDVHGSTSDLTSVLGGVKTSGVDYSSIGFVGDTCLTVANTTSIVQSALGDTDIDVMFSYASSHDTENSADIADKWDYSGEVEGVSEYYLVYTIRETDMQNDTTAEDDFTNWYSGLTAAQKQLPIFIMSHRPLHARRNDNANAADWYTAISAAAESSDIVFFWGHNHTSESSVDTAAYYVAKDGTETFTVYNGSTVTPNFTYMNAGYINANNQNPKRINVATTVKITADSLIFQDYTTSGTYTDATYAHNVTVAREFAAEEVTLSSIAISGTTAYTVGDELALTVTATYSDGTTADVTAAATLSGYNMSTAGTYTVKAEYEGKTAEYTITVSAPYITSVALSSAPTKLTYTVGEELDTTGMVVTATYSDGSTADVTDKAILSGYDMNALGTQTVKVSVNDNGVNFNNMSFVITVEKDMSGLTLEKIDITEPPTKTEYLISQELDLDGMVVVATFSDGSTVELAYKPFSTSTVYGGYELYNFSMNVEKAHEMVVSYTYGGVTCTDTTTINVWNEDFADETTGVKVHVADEDYGVTAVNVSPSSNSNVALAIKDVIKAPLTAYDITLTLDEDVDADGKAVYALTDGDKTVTLPIPDGVNNPVVYYVSDDGASVTNMNAVKDGSGNVTFTTTHFSTYVIGESTEIEVPENETATGSGSTTTTEKKTIYKLVSSLTAGEEYLIVSRNSAGSGYGLAGSTTGASVTVKAADDVSSVVYIEDKGSALEWTASSGWSFTSGSYELGYSNGLSFSTEDEWTFNSNRLYQSVRSGRNTYTYYLRCSSGTWSASTTYSNVYFYQKTEVDVETTTTVSGTYAIAGEDITAAVSEGSTADLSSTLTFIPDSGSETTTDVSTTATYEIVTVDANGNTVDGDPNDIISEIENGVVTFTGNYGTALVKVSYEVSFGSETKTVTDYITVTATAPYYTIQLHEVELTEAADVTSDNFASGTYYTFNSTTGFYHVATAYEEGETYYTTPVVQGDEIAAPIALKGVEAGDAYSIWAVVKEHNSENPDGVDMGELGDALSWSVSDESIATIDETTGVITFTGNNYGTFTVTVAYEGADGKVVTDTITISATESLYVVPGDGTNDFPEYPNEGAVRFDKTATAVGNYSETGIAKVELSMTGVPYTTDNAMDVVVMLDMTGSMSDDGMESAELATIAFVEKIVKNEDGSYNDNRVAVYAFNSGSSSPYELVALSTIKSDSALETANTAIKTASDKQTSGGTPYDEAAKQCYDVLQAAKTTNLPEGVETAADYNRQQFCVFMSDGGPTSYEGSDGYTYYGGNNTSGDRAITSYIGGYDSSTASDWTYNMPTEYYTDLMKADGVTVYTVGLLLQNAPSNPAPWSSMTDSTYDSTTDSLTSIGSHYYFTSTLLKNMATDSSKYIDIFNVDNADNATAKFTAIAQSILEAATDVVVEDKIGNNYTVNFSIPGYGTKNAVSSDALDGTTEFYIQVVEYQLDSNKERTGDPAVLENFTFNSDGTLKSHTVDGVACSGCTHVTTNDAGTITAIDGTYFDYESIEGNGEDAGEYLTWEADKLTTTELTLQYFAYLDNSTGLAEGSVQTPAGTYYTNEYATLTYTNVNGNEVQQEFPIPQMTWNGAQVSYVFYLVNDAGQPVNRAGRVVPFAEAVYVTDVFTYAVKWNDLEQAAGLEAKYLAEELVPDVYALYDDDASYNIHVYEDESEVNLNNHFVIGGDVTDDYATTNSWTNAKTTYVFNNKSDATKYNTVNTYVADDADGDTGENELPYFCKSAAIVNAEYETSVDVGGNTVYTVTSLGNGYQQVSGETQTTVAQITAADGSTTGGTIIDGYIYYVDENGEVYTIVTKTNGNEVHKGFDFSNTTVAFAVVWKPRLETDTVVIDYGLDVVIDVSMNDALASGVVGVRADAPANVAINQGTYTSAKAQTADIYIDANGDSGELKELKIGTASVESLTSVRFSLDKTNGMQMSKPAIFYYESDCNYYKDGKLETNSMYSSVIVIPASTIYYEDEYATLNTFKVDADDSDDDGDKAEYIQTTGWDTSSVHTGKTQEVDRPGDDLISHDYDANNVYGYDAAYTNMATHSMGNAAMVNVCSGKYATAEFTFYGTGFDVISLTSNLSGVMFVKVTDESGVLEKSTMVDTYYGYAKDEATGEWYVVGSDSENALYQVPVIKIEGLNYGKHTVLITASYNSYFDHNSSASGYDLYLDAIRIYDPIADDVVVGTDAEENGKNVTAADIYAVDNEGWPTYLELRNNIIEASAYAESEDGTVTDDVFIEGAIFIDGEPENYSVADYVSYGPNNEVYLDKGQSVAFKVGGSNIASVQLGIKSADGTNDSGVTFAINDETSTVKTTTDMYYDITKWIGDTIVISNSGDSGILSLTNIKFTYSADPNGTNTAGSSSSGSSSGGVSTASIEPEGGEAYIYMTRAAVETTLAALNAPEAVEPEVPEIPEVSDEPETPAEPEVFEPEVFRVKLDNANGKLGKVLKLTITTSDDVESVTVNGIEAREGRTDRKTGLTTWTVRIKAQDIGELTISAIAYNAKGIGSEPVETTVSINAPHSNPGHSKWEIESKNR